MGLDGGMSPRYEGSNSINDSALVLRLPQPPTATVTMTNSQYLCHLCLLLPLLVDVAVCFTRYN